MSDPLQKFYAVKSIPKDKVGKEPELLRREVEILRVVDHPNVVKCYETYEDKRYVHIVMEECPGGSLCDLLTSLGCIPEPQAASLLLQILAGVRHLHALRICHRDIKPENFLFASKCSGGDMKIADFGLARKVGEGEMNTVVGTKDYVAPEVVRGRYDNRCDVWSIGVLLFVMLTGRPPSFSHEGSFAKSPDDLVDFNREAISIAARDLICRMLVSDPDSRLPLDLVLRHQWLSGSAPTVPPSIRVFEELAAYTPPKPLKLELLKVAAGLIPREELIDLKVGISQQAFEAADSDITGFVTAEGLHKAMRVAGLRTTYEEAKGDQ